MHYMSCRMCNSHSGTGCGGELHEIMSELTADHSEKQSNGCVLGVGLLVPECVNSPLTHN